MKILDFRLGSINLKSKIPEALTGLAPYLPEVLPEALEVARAIGKEYNRASALQALTKLLTPNHIDQSLWGKTLLTIILQRFRSFFPEHKDKKLYGILAAVHISPELRKKILQEGFYVARIHDQFFELEIPDNFEPKPY